MNLYISLDKAKINQIEAIQVRITNPNENELLFFKYVHTFHLGKSENNPFTKFNHMGDYDFDYGIVELTQSSK